MGLHSLSKGNLSGERKIENGSVGSVLFCAKKITACAAGYGFNGGGNFRGVIAREFG